MTHAIDQPFAIEPQTVARTIVAQPLRFGAT